MVLKMKLHHIILFLGITISFSCEEQSIVNCDECAAEEPVEADLVIRISEDPNTARTVIKVYEGELEDGILFDEIESILNVYILQVPFNKKYTVTADYYKGNTTYRAVDSAIPRIKYEEEQCENSCFYVYDYKIDLRLKN